MRSLILFLFQEIKSMNLSFVFCILALQSLGLLSLYSASFGHATIFKQQLVWIILSWFIFFCISQINTSFISKILWPLFWCNLIALLAVSFIGREVYSSQRWLDLGLFFYQPSETLKIILMLLAAKKISQKSLGQSFYFLDLLAIFIFVFPPLLLVLLQPDLGTTGIILIMIVTLILFHGVEKRIFLVSLSLFLVSMPLAWSFVLKPYQKVRVVSFIKPGQDPQGSGYNVIQSKIAIGSGQLVGKGFRQGTQNKLQFLPERHTDFIFSVLSEEYGFLGSSFTLFLFFYLISFIFYMAAQTRDRLSCYFSLAVGSFLLWHVVLNLAMTMGLFPVVGIPLPLLSYGGSHMLTTMAFLAVFVRIYKTKDLF